MTAIDRYIRRATLGLPRRQRVDTAAELRVHLNERLRSLSAEGFAREEAEHLVVERMGPVDDVNRRLLNHAFTARAGWTVAAILILGVVAWFAGHYLFAPQLIARPHVLILSDVLPLIGDLAAVDVTLPTTARSSVLGLTQAGAAVFTVASLVLAADAVPDRPDQRVRRTLVVGFPADVAASAPCPLGTRPFVVRSARGGAVATCLGMPVGAASGRWHQLAEGGLPVQFDTWQPLLAFEPTFPPALADDTLPGAHPADGTATSSRDPASAPAQNMADRDDWIVLSVFTSRAPIDELGAMPAPPTGRDLIGAEPRPRFSGFQ